MDQHAKQSLGKVTLDSGSAILFGLAGGLLLGTLIGNLGIGLSVGCLASATANAYFEKRQKLKGGAVALTILLAAWAIVALILLLSSLGSV